MELKRYGVSGSLPSCCRIRRYVWTIECLLEERQDSRFLRESKVRATSFTESQNMDTALPVSISQLCTLSKISYGERPTGIGHIPWYPLFWAGCVRQIEVIGWRFTSVCLAPPAAQSCASCRPANTDMSQYTAFDDLRVCAVRSKTFHSAQALIETLTPQSLSPWRILESMHPTSKGLSTGSCHFHRS